MTDPTLFRDDPSIALRVVEVPDASFANGMNNSASCCSGIGINMAGGEVVGSYEQFTLDDQFENPRTPQIGQYPGGTPNVPRTGNQEFTWDTTQVLYTVAGALSSGGTSGTLPDGSIFAATLPTNAQKEAADPSIDGTVTVTGNATLVSLVAGWTSVP
jgi:hypothetical protein